MKSELRSSILVSVAALTSILISVLTAYAVAETASYTLAAPERFSSIGDINKRSAALFTELGSVLTNPRCVNCHPAGDRPRQGDLSRLRRRDPTENLTDCHDSEKAPRSSQRYASFQYILTDGAENAGYRRQREATTVAPRARQTTTLFK